MRGKGHRDVDIYTPPKDDLGIEASYDYGTSPSPSPDPIRPPQDDDEPIITPHPSPLPSPIIIQPPDPSILPLRCGGISYGGPGTGSDGTDTNSGLPSYWGLPSDIGEVDGAGGGGIGIGGIGDDEPGNFLGSIADFLGHKDVESISPPVWAYGATWRPRTTWAHLLHFDFYFDGNFVTTTPHGVLVAPFSETVGALAAGKGKVIARFGDTQLFIFEVSGP